MAVICQVDAFTDRPFSGNPAGVCVLEEPADEKWMQEVAREMSLPETAFLYPEDDAYNLRWFAPDAEVALCGHATLASAHILWEKGYLGKGETASFFTISGVLTAEFNDGWIELDLPVLPEEETVAPEGLIEALGIEAKYIGRNAFDYIIEIESEKELRSIEPDLSMLAKVTERGVIVTSMSCSGEYDFVSRLFAPAIGIPEDQVTGSAHCCLGPYWMQRLGKDNFNAYQASRRGGYLKVQVKGERVRLFGKAVTVLEGNMLV
ncbi:PhzF family phenazine biosynthesis protein [Methanolobus halotolerans]|uniref:Oxidoreductase n=1 Tax=Methanolobus halotolerans TaxID=2052935 RepID=A0A4E0Q8D8_9EURY|nr:PhzF family phenazine biosynthesis protein [Methanolobus halotolerans]TGC11066.1 oxidoreductase [Methanolobus halotolerans]